MTAAGLPARGGGDGNRTRRAYIAVLTAVTAGELGIDAVLELVDADATTGRIRVARLIAALPGVAADDLDRLMTRLDLATSRRLGSLTALERLDLRALRAYETSAAAALPATRTPGGSSSR